MKPFSKLTLLRLALSIAPAVWLDFAASAPAPLPRRSPVVLPEPHAGDWVLHWGGTQYRMSLGPRGEYEIRPGYHGNWIWDKAGSVLTIHEWQEAGCEHIQTTWRVILDERLSGETEYRGSRVQVKFEKIK